MSRLQVGGLALIVGVEVGLYENLGKVVKLENFIGDHPHPMAKLRDYWGVSSDDLVAMFPNGQVSKVRSTAIAAKNLMPLGDDKGIELYGLREEIMTGHDKEAV